MFFGGHDYVRPDWSRVEQSIQLAELLAHKLLDRGSHVYVATCKLVFHSSLPFRSGVGCVLRSWRKGDGCATPLMIGYGFKRWRGVLSSPEFASDRGTLRRCDGSSLILAALAFFQSHRG